MRLSMSVGLLFLLILATTVQGIRLEEQSLAALHKSMHEKGSLMEDGGVVEVGCRDDGHCSGNRKLITKTMATSKRDKSKEMDVGGGAKNNQQYSSEEADRKREDFDVGPPASEPYPDTIDIAGMDYSPAKRKPPIHN